MPNQANKPTVKEPCFVFVFNGVLVNIWMIPIFEWYVFFLFPTKITSSRFHCIQRKPAEKIYCGWISSRFIYEPNPSVISCFISHIIPFLAVIWKISQRGSAVLFSTVSENCPRFAPYLVGAPDTLILEWRVAPNNQTKAIAIWNYQT